MGCKVSIPHDGKSGPTFKNKSRKIYPIFDLVVPHQKLDLTNSMTRDQSRISCVTPQARITGNYFDCKAGQRSPISNSTKKRKKARAFSVITGRQLQYRMRTSIQRVQTPNVGVYLIQPEKSICCFNFDTCKWQFQSLAEAELLGAGGKEERLSSDLLTELDKFALIAVDDQTIHFIGPAHYKYDLLNNTFEVEEALPEGRANPVLCYGADNIFCFSGVKEGEFSKNAEYFDLKTRTWTTFEPLPRPHVRGAAVAYQAIFAGLSKLKTIVIGGYKFKESTKPTNSASVYDSKLHFWRVIDLQFKNHLTPVLEGIQVIIISSNELYVFGKEENKSRYYRLEPEDNDVTAISEIKGQKDIISLGTSFKNHGLLMISALQSPEGKMNFELYESNIYLDQWSRRNF